MPWMDILLIVVVVLAVILGGLYLLNRRLSTRMVEQQDVIDKNRMTVSIFVIDKRKDKADNVNLTKAVMDQLPRMIKMKKNYFVKAKVGPQITTLMCDKKVFESLPVKKNVKVELVGIYILGLKGGKPGGERPAEKKGFFKRTLGK